MYAATGPPRMPAIWSRPAVPRDGRPISGWNCSTSCTRCSAAWPCCSYQSLLIRRLPGRRWRLLLIPAVAMTVLDYGENAAVWNILSTWPAVGDLPAHLGGAATVAKRAAGLVAYLAVPLLLLTVGLDRLRIPARTRAGAADSSR